MNWHNVVETASVAVTKDVEDIVNKFIEENSMQVMNDLVTAIANAEIDFGTNSIYG